MPSTYAHYRFANEVIPLLPRDIRAVVEANKELYFMGCHGPDILFYYKPLTHNAIRKLGDELHIKKAKPFFEGAKAVAAKSDAALSYAIGFITHFALDSECHDYVEAYRRQHAITHTKVEVEFDRYLLEDDGKDAVRTKLAEHILSEERYSGIIAPFFNLEPEKVKRALKDMKKVCDMFVVPKKGKRAIITKLLKMFGGDSLKDQVMGYFPDPVCEQSNKVLFEKFEGAKPIAKRLAVNFCVNLNNKGLDARFDKNYE